MASDLYQVNCRLKVTIEGVLVKQALVQ